MSRSESAPTATDTTETDVAHGGPSRPWETILATFDHQVTREELAYHLTGGDLETVEEAMSEIDGALARGELTFDGDFVRSSSRHSNQDKSVNLSRGDSPGSDDSEVIDQLVSDFREEFGPKADLPVAMSDGASIRRDYADIDREWWSEDQPDGHDFEPAASGEEVVDVSAKTWSEAVREVLSDYAETKATTLNLRKGEPDHPDFTEFSVEAENRWFETYQRRYYAQIDGWLRELTGGERPSGGETEATFDDPRIVLLTRSASSTVDQGAASAKVNPDRPGRARVGPVDHLEHLRDSWESVYHTLRNTLRSEGYELGEDWQYDRRLEPHTAKNDGPGINKGYTHEHIVVVVDGPISSSDLRPVMDKHVEATEWAGEEAHGEEAIEVRKPSELYDPAAYVANYVSVSPDGLFDRGPTYHAFAATVSAANVRTLSRSESAKAAAQADMCKQRYESDKSEQSHRHGENVVRSDRPGYSYECAECGSPHGIDQDETLTGHRLDSPDGPSGPTGPAMVDGGQEVRDKEARKDDLKDRWPSATKAVQYGEDIEKAEARSVIEETIERDGKDIQDAIVRAVVDEGIDSETVGQVAREVGLDIDPNELVAIDRPDPSEWELHSVEVRGEEYVPTSSGSVDMVEVTNPRQQLEEALDLDPAAFYRCECGVGAYGTSGWGGYGPEAPDWLENWDQYYQDMIGHLLAHGLTDPEKARQVIEVERPADMGETPERRKTESGKEVIDS